MEEKIIRPTTKPEAIKGKLLKYQGTDYCEFMPKPRGRHLRLLPLRLGIAGKRTRLTPCLSLCEVLKLFTALEFLGSEAGVAFENRLEVVSGTETAAFGNGIIAPFGVL